MLNPAFSVAHMRQMSKDVCHSPRTRMITVSPAVPIFYGVAHKVRLPNIKWTMPPQFTFFQLGNTLGSKLATGAQEVSFFRVSILHCNH